MATLPLWECIISLIVLMSWSHNHTSNSPFHTVIPVNCHKITGTTLPVNPKMCCSHMISLRQFTGNFPEKSVCVKGAIVKIIYFKTFVMFPS